MKFLSSLAILSVLAPAIPVLTANICIDINTAPEKELEKVKHIGQSRAEQIIKLRKEKSFSSVDELNRVPGIGPSRISDIKKQGLACVSGSPVVEIPSQNVIEPSQTAAVAEQILKTSKSLYVFLTAFALAIFSGFVILFLKKKIKS